MGRLRLSKLPLLVILCLYIGRLVATVHHHDDSIEEEGLLHSKCSQLNSKRSCLFDDDELDRLSSLLSKTDSLTETSDILSDLPSSIPVTFDPPLLDFKEQSIGMPVLRVVKLTNPTNSLTLQLISISGTLPDFHTSFFVEKVLRPGETTSFDVMFLARVSGELEDTIIIHSSLGIFEYKVRGVGESSPFRLRSLRGARIPLNATYQPVISLYNPYPDPLQILEVYSSSDFIHLEMPSGTSEGNKTAWGIRPYETKTIARVNFHGHVIDNYTAFIRIRSNHPSQPSLVLPFEVEVCKAHGLFLSREYLDFGVVRTGTESKLWLYMLNAGPYTIELKSMTLPDDLPIVVNFTKISLKPGLKYVRVASLSFFVNSSTPGGKSSGMIKIWGEDHTSFYHVQVPYEAHIMKGSLEFDATALQFRVNDPPFYPIIRNLTLTNLFQYPVVIYSAKLSSKVQSWFSILSFNSPYVLPADGLKHTALVLKFNIQSSDCLLNTTLRLSTNMSFFNIPIQCYDGRLDYTFEESDAKVLEFGVLTDQDRVSKIFTITNNNPVKVAINSISVKDGSHLPGLSVDTIKAPPHEPNTRTLAILKEGLRSGRMPPQHVLAPGQSVVYRVNVTRPKRPGQFSGELLIHSSLGKVTTIPVNYVAIKGEITIIPKRIKFLPSLPGLYSSVRLSVKNTFTKPVKLVSVVANSSSTNASLPLLLPSDLPTLKPSTTTLIGDVKLDPLTVLLDEKKLTKIKFNCTSLIIERVKSDAPLTQEFRHLKTLWSVWADLLRGGSNLLIQFNLNMFYNVNNERGVASVSGEGSLIWPRIASSHTMSFPLILIGNHTELKLSIRNPSPHPLYVQPLLLSDHPDSAPQLLPLLSEIYNLRLPSTNFTSRAFSVLSGKISNKEPPSDPTIILPPQGSGTLTVRYKPLEETNNNALLILRNNLTVLDPVVLRGSCSRGFLTIDGVHPHGNQPLVFDFTQYLNGLECGMQSDNIISHWKIFHIRNSGPAPFTIKRTSIGSSGGCEGHGFKILNCDKPFIVYPNRTRTIEIRCSPDFSLSRITSTLRLHTMKGSHFEFPLLATLPHHMLSLCYMATPPSDIEYMVAYFSVPLWIIALLIMTIVTVLQVKWHSSVLFRDAVVGKDVPVQSTGGKTFSLSNIRNASPTNPLGSTPPPSSPPSLNPSSQSVSSQVKEMATLHEIEGTKSLSADSLNNSTIHSSTNVPCSSSSSSLFASGHVTISAANNRSSSVQDRSCAVLPAPPTKMAAIKPLMTTEYETGMRHQTTELASPVSSPSLPSNKANHTPSPDTRSHPLDASTKKGKTSQRKQSKGGVAQTQETPPTQTKQSLVEDLLERKESNDSLPSSETSSGTGGGGASTHTSTSDEAPPTTSPELEEISMSVFKKAPKTKPHPHSSKPHPAYAKEPLTGQTFEVKEDVPAEEVESDLTTPPAELTTPPQPVKPTRSKKKQKIQSKKEDKLTRRKQQREKEIEQQTVGGGGGGGSNNSNNGLRNRRYQGSQESLDKESVASNSTNSTDQYEEEAQLVFVDAPTCQEELKKDESACSTKSKEEDKNNVIEEKSKEELVLSQAEDITPKKEDEIGLLNETPPSPVVEETLHTNKGSEETREPSPKPPRPQKLALPAKEEEEEEQETEQALSSVEADTVHSSRDEGNGGQPSNNEKRLAPHELAASLLQTNKDIIVRRANSGGGTTNSVGGGGGEGEKSKGNKSSSPVKDKTKKKSSGGGSNGGSSQEDNKRSNPSPSSLSHDAQPFYPGYTPFPPHPPHSRPHPPLLMQPHPPTGHPLPYDYHAPPPHHMRYPQHHLHEEAYAERSYEGNRKLLKHKSPFPPPPPPPPGVVPAHRQYMYHHMDGPLPPPPPPYREMTPPHLYEDWPHPHLPPHHHAPDPNYYLDPEVSPYYKRQAELGRGHAGGGHPPSHPPGWRQGVKRTSFDAPPISHVKPHVIEEYEHVPPHSFEEPPLVHRGGGHFRGYHDDIDHTPHHSDSYSMSRLREVGGVASHASYHDELHTQKMMASKKRSEMIDMGGARVGGTGGTATSSGTSLSLLLSQSSSSGWSSSLNRAPGTIPSNNQYSKMPSTLYGVRGGGDSGRGWVIDEDDKDLFSRHETGVASGSDDTSTCQRLWSLNSPLSNALEAQRLQTAAQLSSAPSPPPQSRSSLFSPPTNTPGGVTTEEGNTNNYDPFDNSLSSIWSFGNRDNAGRGGSLLWDTDHADSSNH